MKKKRTYSANVAKTLKGNQVITLTAPEIFRKVKPIKLPYYPILANNSKKIALRTERSLSESRFKAIQNDNNNNIFNNTVPTTIKE